LLWGKEIKKKYTQPGEGSQEISSPSSFCVLLFLAFLLMHVMEIEGSSRVDGVEK
jgi:hypothetical protein